MFVECFAGEGQPGSSETRMLRASAMADLAAGYFSELVLVGNHAKDLLELAPQQGVYRNRTAGRGTNFLGRYSTNLDIKARKMRGLHFCGIYGESKEQDSNYNILNANDCHVYCMRKIFSLLKTMQATMLATKIPRRSHPQLGVISEQTEQPHHSAQRSPYQNLYHSETRYS